MSTTHRSLLRKTFFVPQSDDDLVEARRSLSKQIFQMAYFGKLSPEYASSLEVSERNYMYKLLEEQLKDENKRQEEEANKAKAQASKIKSSASRARRR